MKEIYKRSCLFNSKYATKDIIITTNGSLKGENGNKDSRAPTTKNKTILGKSFLVKGYRADTIGLDEEKVKKYVNYQEDQ